MSKKHSDGYAYWKDRPVLEMFESSNLFLLPPVVVIEKKAKRYVKELPDTTVLKAQQKQVFDSLVFFTGRQYGEMSLVQGYAGTGKTFLMSLFIEHFLAGNRQANIAVAAPANKAVKLAANQADYTHTNLTYGTVHKLLGLKEVINKHGEVEFKPDIMNPPIMDSVELLVLDEVSQLSDELFELLLPYVKRGGLKIVFVGDAAQIPPVGKADCIPLRKDMQKMHGIRVESLTDIIRQAMDNPIIATTFVVRENLTKNRLPMDRETNLRDDGTGVIHITKSIEDDKEFMVKILERYFVSENFKKNADFMKVVAWRNKTVAAMNKIVRKLIYGEEQSDNNQILIGEKLIANEPVFDDWHILFTTSDEFEVESYTEKTELINGGQYSLQYFETKVFMETADGHKDYQTIKVLSRDSQDLYDQILEQLKNIAVGSPKGAKSSKAWEDFYKFKRYFANVGYNYAITAHKAQGSTYENCMVLEFDMDKNWNVIERNRIKYTAFSRPKSKLIIVN